MNFSTEHIDYLERDFLDEAQDLMLSASEQLAPHPASIHLLQIKNVPREFSKNRPRTAQDLSMTDILAGLHGLGSSLAYVIIGEPKKVSLYMATCRHPNSEQNDTLARSGSMLSPLLVGAYPGIELVESDEAELSALQDGLRSLSHSAILTGTPSVEDDREIDDEQRVVAGLPMDRLIRSLYGTRWAYITVARPVAPRELQDLSNATLNELRRVANAQQSAGAKSPLAEKYEEILDVLWRKMQLGKSQGMWHTLSYLLAGDEPTLRRIEAAGKSVFSGESSLPDPIRVLHGEAFGKHAANFSLPVAPPPESPGEAQYPFRYLSLLNSNKLSAVIHLPTQEAAGYFVRSQAHFDVTPHHREHVDGSVEIGAIVHEGRHTGLDYALDPETLKRHTMVVGTTGSGKTNTIFHMLRQLTAQGVPFLVIEPAKAEYRTLLESEMGTRLRVFTLGDETVSPFRLNPFEIRAGFPVQTHIDHLKSAFNASFILYAPMPYVLERCIHEIYTDKGWDLVTNENARGRHPRAHPTLSDLYAKIDPMVARLGYDVRLTRDITAALKTRINSLRIGGKGMMLDTHVSLPVSALLEGPTILELDHIGDDDEKAFLIGLILIALYEHYQALGYREVQGLRHVTVVEEAHRLLKRVPEILDTEAANMAGKAVESFSNMLAEIRAYGEGLIVAEQIPTKLAADIVKNTNLKITHRVVAEDDKLLMAGAMSVERDEARWLGLSRVGEAAVFGGDDDRPILVKVPYRKIETTGEGRDPDQWVRDAMASFRDQHAATFHPYPWADVSPEFIAAQGAQPRRIVEEREFQEVFARYVVSVVATEEALFAEFPSVVQAVRQGGRSGAGAESLKITLLYAVDWLFETRGRQFGAAYTDVEQLKKPFASILLNDVLDVWDPSGPQSQLSSGLRERVAAFQADFKRIFHCESDPLIAGDITLPGGVCRYRYEVEPLVHDRRLRRRFTNALAESSGPELWERVAETAQAAARRVISDLAPVAERRKAGLCFAVQASETLPTLDRRLREKLLAGLLAYLSEPAREQER